jgi:hypothetical protein
MTLIVTVAWAEARLVARNAAGCCAPAIGGADEGETEAANKIRGPNIGKVISQCARHG